MKVFALLTATMLQAWALDGEEDTSNLLFDRSLLSKGGGGGNPPAPMDPTRYNLGLDISRTSGAARTAFINAGVRWEQVIRGDLQDISTEGLQQDETSCPLENIPAIIDDNHVCASVVGIDGSGGTLARAGVEFARLPTNKLPVMGAIEFDSADTQGLINAGDFESTAVRFPWRLQFCSNNVFPLVA